MKRVKLTKPDDLGFVEITHTYKPKNKYHAKKIVMAGRVYDSKKECLRAAELRLLQTCGAISDLQEQVRFVLQEPFVNNYGKKIRAIEYVADFTYTENGKQVVEDCKGVKTDVFKLKHKMFEKKYPDKFFRFS